MPSSAPFSFCPAPPFPSRLSPHPPRRPRHRPLLCSAPSSPCYPPGKTPPRLFLDVPLTPGSLHALPPLEAAHLRALRHPPHLPLTLFNSRGAVAVATLGPPAAAAAATAAATTTTAQAADTLHILSVRGPARRARPLRAVVALPKSAARADWAVEKLTELGAHAVVFVRTSRVEARAPRRQRWSRVAVAAAKQSLRADVPDVAYAADFEECVVMVREAGVALVLAAAGEPVLGGACVEAVRAAKDVVVVVGPEGGFTKGEEGRLVEAGARLVSLAGGRLRVETAVVTAVGILQQIPVEEVALVVDAEDAPGGGSTESLREGGAGDAAATARCLQS